MRLARALLDLAHGLSSARDARSLTVDDLAARVGCGTDDIEMIEEGDVSDTSLLLRVIDALDVRIELSSGFQVVADTKVAA